MFVGFIAVVVILLVIVGIMSSGATSGSGGVDQTKATKVLGEISGLAQSAGFYKTTVATSNYAGMDLPKLVDAGIVSLVDTVTAAGVPAANSYESALVISKAANEIVYTINADTNNANRLVIGVLENPDAAAAAMTDSLGSALETSYGKIATADSTGEFDPAETTTGSIADLTADTNDGLATIYLQQ